MPTFIVTYPGRIDPSPVLEGKFLQLRLAGGDYLLFAAAAELRYHNQILARFLSSQDIPHRWEREETLVFAHPDLAILGGGRFRLDQVGKTLRVWDASGVYGRFDAAALSAQIDSADAPWQGLSLSVA